MHLKSGNWICPSHFPLNFFKFKAGSLREHQEETARLLLKMGSSRLSRRWFLFYFFLETLSIFLFILYPTSIKDTIFE